MTQQNTHFVHGMLSDIPVVANEDRTVSVVLSASKLNTRELIPNQENWNLVSFKQSPRVYFEGDDRVVAKCTSLSTHVNSSYGRYLGASIRFEENNNFAEEVFQRVLFGIIAGCKTYFSETGTGHKRNGDYCFIGQELLSVQLVSSIPLQGIKTRQHKTEPRLGQMNKAARLYAQQNLLDYYGFKLEEIERFTGQEILSLLRGRAAGLKELNPGRIPNLLEQIRIEKINKQRLELLCYGTINGK